VSAPHSPTPWIAKHRFGTTYILSGDVRIAAINDAWPDAENSVKTILTAVNSHANLLAALERTLKWQGVLAGCVHKIGMSLPDYAEAKADFEAAQSALAQAEAKP
jgi:hypothetical protein